MQMHADWHSCRTSGRGGTGSDNDARTALVLRVLFSTCLAAGMFVYVIRTRVLDIVYIAQTSRML